jgi:pyrimidine nucleoside transport protein
LGGTSKNDSSDDKKDNDFLGWLLYVTVGTTAAESMNAAANIFLGQTEAPLLIKPFLPLMTK